MAEQSNFTEAQLAELQKYFRSIDGRFEILSGHESVGHGKGEWCLTTESAQGIHIYEQGNMKISSNLTMEIITGHDGEEETGKILIRAMSGDVHIEAPNGDLILKGKNVQINSTDAKGFVSITSPSNVQIDGANVNVSGENTQVTGTGWLTTLGGYVTNHGENQLQQSEGHEEILDGSILQKIISAIEEVKKFFKSICE